MMTLLSHYVHRINLVVMKKTTTGTETLSSSKWGHRSSNSHPSAWLPFALLPFSPHQPRHCFSPGRQWHLPLLSWVLQPPPGQEYSSNNLGASSGYLMNLLALHSAYIFPSSHQKFHWLSLSISFSTSSGSFVLSSYFRKRLNNVENYVVFIAFFQCPYSILYIVHYS